VSEAYEASQKQRTLEKAVKKQKQKLVCTETAIKNTDDDILKAELKADFDHQAVKLKERESKLDDFCKQTGRKIDSHRVQVYGFDRSVSSKAVWGNKRVANSANGAIIKNNNIQSEVIEVHSIGKIDRNIYKCVTDDIQTDDVIITDERIGHIKERHPNDYEKYCQYMREAVVQPDYIIESNKPNTALILKEISDDDLQFKTILRLVTSNDNPEFKNSIITFMKIDEKEWKRLIKNKKILYKSE